MDLDFIKEYESVKEWVGRNFEDFKKSYPDPTAPDYDTQLVNLLLNHIAYVATEQNIMRRQIQVMSAGLKEALAALQVQNEINRGSAHQTPSSSDSSLLQSEFLTQVNPPSQG